MAYTDQRTGGNQRAAAITIVALIQGAAVVALINGLAVQWIERPPEIRTEGEQIRLEPIATPVPPPPEPDTRVTPERRIDNPIPRLPLPDGRVSLPPMPPLPPIPGDPFIPRADPAPEPSPTSGFAPRGAKPRNAPGGWATSADYPARDLREGNQGVTGFTLAIGADGKVQSCAITQTSGSPTLDRATCDNVSRRARFEPATDNQGNRTGGTYSGRIRWQIPQG